MPEPISMTVVAKKVAVKALTSKKLRNIVIGTVLGLLLLLVAPIVFLFGIAEAGQSLDWSSSEMQLYVYENMPPEAREQMESLDQLMWQILLETHSQGIYFDERFVQVFFLGIMLEQTIEETTIADFVACFDVEEGDYDRIFINIGFAFGLWFYYEEEQQILAAARSAVG